MPWHLNISELRTRLAQRTLSAQEAMRACLERIGRVDAGIGAFLGYDAEDAMSQARAADEALARGMTHSRLPLLGVPVAIKDIIAVKDQPLTCASRILEGFVSPYDATVIEKLRQAGAVVFGRLNLDEFAMGSSTENSAFHPTSNPWDRDRVSGGSSGGSAAAVATGMAFGALGSDTGGSVRQPAAHCGCVGLKPTYGRVSRFGLVAFASSLDQVGPLTRTVGDAAILLGALAGPDPRDSTSIPEAVPDYEAGLGQDLRGLRLGLPREYLVGGLDPEVKDAVEAAVRQFSALGAEIVEVSLPHTEYAVATYYIIATAEASANLARFDGVRYGRRVDGADPTEMYGNTRGQGFGAEVKRRIILGTYVLSRGYYEAYYLRAQKVRTLICDDFRKAFAGVQAIVAPVTPTAAFRLGEKIDDPLQLYLMDIFTSPCNLAGICGISVPCGFTRRPRLPIGLQILGPALGEAMVLRVAHAYEQSTSWHRERPPLPD